MNMKSVIKNFTIVTFICSLIIFVTLPTIAQTADNTHIRYGYPPDEYLFYNIPEDVGYLQIFPLEQIQEAIPAEYLDEVVLEFWVHTSVEDAEWGVVDNLYLNALWLPHVIDHPLEGGSIGDNCFQSIKETGSILFLRNNVRVFIIPKEFGDFDAGNNEFIARTIDSILIKSAKVFNSSEIPAPEIQSVELLEEGATSWLDRVLINIYAIDPNGEKTYYRKYFDGHGIYEETGTPLAVSMNQYTDTTTNPAILRAKIWVWSENSHIIESLELDIPF